VAAAAKPFFFFQLRNILFATDFSPASEAALPVARALAERFGSVLHIVHVLPAVPPVAPMDSPVDLDLYEEAAEYQMAKMLLRQPLRGITYNVAIERGSLGCVLEKEIAARCIDLLVLGTHGRSGLSKLVLGSVAEEIFRRATCPVLTIGPHVPPQIAEGRIKTILYASDFSSGAQRALPYAAGLARESQAQLKMLHVLSVAPVGSAEELERITNSFRQRLLDMLSPAVEMACKAEAIVLFGSAAEGILRGARECQADLIVMGANLLSRGLANVHLPWATAHRVVCEAGCPVLTVRA
jgi:nucleotide-binding universal stress UspA family protein